jgi:hypothetical protein
LVELGIDAASFETIEAARGLSIIETINEISLVNPTRADPVFKRVSAFEIRRIMLA